VPHRSLSDVASNVTPHQAIKALAVIDGKLDEALMILDNGSQVLLGKIETVSNDF
jgi:hypothetical protein